MERVRDRLMRASAALDRAGVPYAVAGGNAVAAWVATVDATAVRNTQDVDILLRRADLDAAAQALATAGFVRRHLAGIDLFLDGLEAKPRDAVHVVIAGEKVRPEYHAAAPDVTESQRPEGFSVVALEALVRMKLTSFRRKDQVHLQDMLDIGLIDATWTTRFEPELAARLQQLIDTPDQESAPADVMLFNSISFLIFFPFTTLAYFAMPHRWRWMWLLLCSAGFYALFIPKYLLILLLVIAIDYIAGLMIEPARGGTRRAFLILSLVANIGLLAAFKYFNFVNDNVRGLAEMLHWNYPVRNLGWLLPIGLSFHTFQSMAYTIEVYLGRWKAERHLGIYALYVLFYPQLVAGPIERPQNLLPQFRRVHPFDPDRIYSGLRLMLWGFFKKLVIADRLAAIVDAIYGHPHAWGGGYLLLATYAFAIQIYCDFSGYTDIAIGAARVLGFRLMTNFDRPYAARSVAEFWRRWHISLSTWFRDYLYIPLGGSRVGPSRWVVNILIVFLISGLWHGASWTYVAWGLLHGVYMIVSRWTRRARERIHAMLGMDPDSAILPAWQTFATFNLVAFAWIFFRAGSMSDAGWIVTHLAPATGWLMHPRPVADLLPFTRDDLVLALALVVVLELVQWAWSRRALVSRFQLQPAWVRWPAYYAVIIAILWVGDLGARSFIYFQF